MKICVILLVLVSYVSADCCCSNCSRHLQGVEIPGPAGLPVKVIFRRVKPSGCGGGCGGGCGCCCGCDAPCKPPPPKIKEVRELEPPGGQYSATIQLPRPIEPKPQSTLRNLKYRTDTILVEKPPDAVPLPPSSGVDPSSLTSTDILKWLKNLEVSHQLAAEQKLQQERERQPSAAVPQIARRCPAFQKPKGNVSPELNSFNTENPLGCSYQRTKGGISLQETAVEDPNSNASSPMLPVRSKRDLPKRGYNLLMNMLPQSIRGPLHHSVQGAKYIQQSRIQPITKQKLNQPHHSLLPQQKNIFNQPSRNAYGKERLNYFQQPQPPKNSFLDRHLDNAKPSPLNGVKTRIRELVQTDAFGSAKKSSKFSPNPEVHWSESTPKHNSPFKKGSSSTDPLVENRYKTFLQKYDLQNSQTASSKLSQNPVASDIADEKTLLKKLKRLNNNPYSSNLEDQATAFVQQLLKPEKSRRRSKRSCEEAEKELARKKRTIIVGSDEINLPYHYEVEMVSVEDESEETHPEEADSFEELEEEEEEEDSIVGASRRRVSPPRRMYPSLPILQPKPELILGKNVIQKAVREELQAHHKKVEQEKRVKEMKENLRRKKQQPFGVPQNPIFALLTAPVKFLKHFHGLNRGVSPIITTIPKLIYTTKKVFKDLGRDFQRNCLDLASNVIGDFDHIHPSVIQQISEPNGRRYRRDVLKAENNIKANTRNTERRSNKKRKISILKDTKRRPEDRVNKLDQTNKTETFVKSVNKTDNICMQKPNTTSLDGCRNETTTIPNLNHKADNLKPLTNVAKNNQEKMEATSETTEKPLNDKSKMHAFEPDYTLVFENSKEMTNFREVPDKHFRKKRYVVRVVDDDEVQDQVEEYLTEKFGGQYDYHNPLQNYYQKVNGVLNKLFSTHQPLCQAGGECYYQRTAPAEESYEDQQESLESFEDSFEEKPTRKKMQIKKVKPRIIIDNKGRPFMESNGYKRPLLIRGKKFGILKKTNPVGGGSSEETGNKIATLIARAKEDSEIVGNTHKDIVPHQMVKERISSLLEEIDQLVHLNADNYDEIFEDLIKIEHVKTSIEQDWKRLLIDDKVNDIAAKIGLFSKFKELQQIKESAVKKIAAALKKNDNEFVRCQLVNSLIRLQKLQCLITSVVEDFEQHLKMKTSFNTNREIKYVDYLAGLKFAFAKTRNDLIKMLSKDRDSEGLKYVEMLHKLKELLISVDENPEKLDHAAEVLWEMKNLEKMQMETIKDMNKKLSRHLKIKKELKILFDLQKRFEDCNKELSEVVGAVEVNGRGIAIVKKKDIKEVIAEVKKRHEEMLQKAKERSRSIVKKS